MQNGKGYHLGNNFHLNGEEPVCVLALNRHRYYSDHHSQQAFGSSTIPQSNARSFESIFIDCDFRQVTFLAYSAHQGLCNSRRAVPQKTSNCLNYTKMTLSMLSIPGKRAKDQVSGPIKQIASGGTSIFARISSTRGFSSIKYRVEE